MKFLWAAISLALVIAVGLGAMIKLQKDPWGPPPAPAAEQADALIARWNAQKVPQDKRTVTLVVYDRTATGSPLDPPEEFDKVSRPNPLDRLTGGSRPDPETTAFLGAMAEAQDVILVRYRPGEAERRETAKTVKEAVVKAHDAGAEINVVTQGAGVAPAVQAIAELEGATRQGVPVGVNKLVALGIERPKLKAIDPFFRSDPRPRNVLEWASFYREPGSVPPKTFLELSSRGGAPVHYSGGLSKTVGADPAKSVTELLAEVRPISSAANAAAKEEKAAEPAGSAERPFRALEGQMSMKAFKAELPSRPPKPTTDSIGMIQAPPPDTSKALVADKGACGVGYLPLPTDTDWCCPDKPLVKSPAPFAAERQCASNGGCLPAGYGAKARNCRHAIWVEDNNQWWCCQGKEKMDRFNRCYEEALFRYRSAAGCKLAAGLLLKPIEPKTLQLRAIE
ncbi:MAG: hypothetical protein HY553_00590 [Elusimicrobia bacterium]|nr:hypothetical protein [Elusimicrobiota bacterium]